MKIRILLIEDDQADAFLIREMLREPITGGTAATGDIAIQHVTRLDDGIRLAGEDAFDIIISDLGLPDSQGMDTVRKLASGVKYLPFVVLTGLADHELGLEAVNRGAQDYLVKGQVNGEMLVRSIRYAIERKRIENEKEQVIAELQEALAKVKLLSGFIPICASCKKIRDDTGYWQQVEAYIQKHSNAEFSHSICPDCSHKLYPELYPEPPGNTDPFKEC
ncbi:MAG: response regulator [Desulfurivibrionaceae bacterium]|jgi:DNA-binding response OmpR family regulator|nr:response regulator [Desulfobulbaceae bacterium]MDP2003910.1 response regulator [Desulfurivibrionaceae bacterium]MDP2757918.1 response regulator [Desulfurivibrionaceae bacterium]